jgi:hypothetical protein
MSFAGILWIGESPRSQGKPLKGKDYSDRSASMAGHGARIAQIFIV